MTNQSTADPNAGERPAPDSIPVAEADALARLRQVLDSVPWREAVGAYRLAYPGRDEIDLVDVLRWLTTRASLTDTVRAENRQLLEAVADMRDAARLIATGDLLERATEIAARLNVAENKILDLDAELARVTAERDGAVAQLYKSRNGQLAKIHAARADAAERRAAQAEATLDRARATMIRAMDALESDAERDERCEAFELIQDQFEGVSHDDHGRAEALIPKLRAATGIAHGD